MTDIKVEDLANQIGEKVGGISVDQLIKQLNNAGIPIFEAKESITIEQKEQLLNYLAKGKIDGTKQRKTLTLNRKKVGTLKVKGTKKTISVVTKKKRTYVRKTPEAIAAEEAEKIEIEAEQARAKEEAQKQAEQEKINAAKDASTKETITKSTVADPTKQVTKDPKEPVEPKAKKDKPKKDTTSGKKDQKRGKGRLDPTENKRKYKSLSPDYDESSSIRTRRKSKIKVRGITKEVEEIASKHAFAKPTEPVTKEISVPDVITVAEIANQLSVKAGEVIKSLMKMGVMATINQSLDQDTACLIIEELGHKAVPHIPTTVEDEITIEYEEASESRPPVITIMGHVDHGKTSLLDYIRKTRVTEKESGGITQHIGAYTIDPGNGKLTFLDTPGHSAFTAMRSRGAKCTDIVILVVAADDGVMPQTVEAIQHAKAAKVPIIVAVNKIDKAEADPEKVTTELSQHDLIPEAWGGDTQFIHISAKEGTGVDGLLESIVLQSEILELKAPSKGAAKGVVIESRLDKGRGPVASILVQTGSLKKGDMVLAGMEVGRVRSMVDDLGEQISVAGPSTPVEILGLSGIPNAGDEFLVVESEKRAKEVASHRQVKAKEMKLARQQASKLEGFMDKMKQSDIEIKELNIILKADVIGSLEALREALLELSNEEVKVKIIAEAIGGFNESDINLAMASSAVLIGFNVRADSAARKLAEAESIKLNYFSIIYDVVDCIKSAVEGKIAPKFEEKIIGIAEVRDVFKSSKIGSIAGCMVIDGTIKRGKSIRVLRDNIVIYEGELESLRRFKEDINEVRKGTECGIGVKNYNDVKVKDQIETYEKVEIVLKKN